jgi:hypothetical protein
MLFPERVDSKQYEEIEKDDDHDPDGCATVVKNAVEWVAELVLGEK